MPDSLKLYDAQASRQIDQAAREQLRLSGFELMARAARAALEAILDRYPEARSLSIWGGKGNNAGDGWLLGAQAVELGLAVQLVGLESTAAVQGDAALALNQAQAHGLVLEPYAETLEVEGDVVVDALLGTGFHGALRSPYDAAIARLNAVAQPVVSIDVPSGVDASTGGVLEQAVSAAMTVTFITPKIGLHTGAGPDHAGEVVFHDLGVDPSVYPAAAVRALRFRKSDLTPLVRQSYKHVRGHVAVVGGEHGMGGAVVLASTAALRSGAGLVTAFTRAAHCPLIVGHTPEVMAVAVDALSADKLTQADIVVLGPGLGRDEWGLARYLEVEASKLATVLDADGLYHLAVRGAWQGGPLFITPHVGEAARLLGITAREVELDRLAAVVELGNRYQASVVLKGPGSVVGGQAREHVVICDHGNPGMASAGMGDVLAGVAGGLLAHGCRVQAERGELDEVFAQAVALHSAAADHAAGSVGQRSLLASDVIASLPVLLK